MRGESLNELSLAGGAIEREPADLVVVALFAGERPLRGAAGRIDWRLCGRLSHLCASGHARGEPGEAVLMPGGGGVRAPRVLALGIGARAALDAAGFARWIADAFARAQGLRARRLILSVPDAAEGQLVALARCAAESETVAECALAPDPVDVPAVSDWLRTAARRSSPAGLEIRSPGEMRAPQGARRGAEAPESSRELAGRFTR